jgi:PIN domain nuclease of toxin-antitoxin system
MVIKAQLGKLLLRLPLADVVSAQQSNGLRILPVTLTHVLAVENLPPVHKDPFDRVLIAQANIEGSEFVSADAVAHKYPVSVLW